MRFLERPGRHQRDLAPAGDGVGNASPAPTETAVGRDPLELMGEEVARDRVELEFSRGIPETAVEQIRDRALEVVRSAGDRSFPGQSPAASREN